MADEFSDVTATTISQDILAGAVEKVPYVGEILGKLVPTLWPGQDNSVWDSMQAQVEELVQEEISNEVSARVQATLTGLNNVLDDYLTAVNANGDVSTNWTSALQIFDSELPQFQEEGYEVLLLPLFAQAVNLYLSLLRDGVLFGASWGWSSDYQQAIAKKMTDAIPSYVSYAKTYFEQGVEKVTKETKSNNHDCQPFRSVNAYKRQMTFGVSDHGQLWPFLNPTQFGIPMSVYLGREVYSDPVGTCDDSGNIVLPSPPSEPPNQITVWAWDRVDAVQLTYPSGVGPGGVTETARMGDQSGGSNQGAPHGGVFNVKDNPVVIAGGAAGDILNSFKFTYKNNGNTGKLGGSGGSSFSFSYNGHILSSIHINGVSKYYGSADCAVFGFRYELKSTSGFGSVVSTGWAGS